MNNRRSGFLFGGAVLLLALLLGCAGGVKNMRPVPPGQALTVPERGQSMVVFIRPSPFGVAVESSLFKVEGDALVPIGTLVAQQKLSYPLEPGRHLFMVMGRNVDYLSADLRPDRIYYARIDPVMGKWIGRFEIAPMPINQLYSARFKRWLQECEEVERIAAADDEEERMATARAQHRAHYARWLEQQPKKPGLLPRDGKQAAGQSTARRTAPLR